MEITKWEYISFKKYKNDNIRYDSKGVPRNVKGVITHDDDILNDLGKKGWEVVGIPVEGNNGCISSDILLKRPCGRLQVIEKVNGVPINQEQDRSDGVER